MPAPEIRKKNPMPHVPKNEIGIVIASLSSAFFTCQSSVENGCRQW
ncbi:MAG TPA: hypothetical protein VJ979_03025 [Actinomycetota bacterium]|nr:hypothetical protein [Actinomycetota bacterium]